MTRRLHAFSSESGEPRLVGVFEDRDGLVSFTYADPGRTPLSVSLPIDEPHATGAAGAYLDNLLPDDDRVRTHWAREAGTASTDPIDLLARYGEDVAGAIFLTATWA